MVGMIKKAMYMQRSSSLSLSIYSRVLPHPSSCKGFREKETSSSSRLHSLRSSLRTDIVLSVFTIPVIQVFLHLRVSTTSMTRGIFFSTVCYECIFYVILVSSWWRKCCLRKESIQKGSIPFPSSHPIDCSYSFHVLLSLSLAVSQCLLVLILIWLPWSSMLTSSSFPSIPCCLYQGLFLWCTC